MYYREVKSRVTIYKNLQVMKMRFLVWIWLQAIVDITKSHAEGASCCKSINYKANYRYTRRSILMKVYTHEKLSQNWILLQFFFFFQKWKDQISKQRQAPACIFSLENCAEIPDEEKLGHSAGDCKACARIRERKHHCSI